MGHIKKKGSSTGVTAHSPISLATIRKENQRITHSIVAILFNDNDVTDSVLRMHSGHEYIHTKNKQK